MTGCCPELAPPRRPSDDTGVGLLAIGLLLELPLLDEPPVDGLLLDEPPSQGCCSSLPPPKRPPMAPVRPPVEMVPPGIKLEPPVMVVPLVPPVMMPLPMLMLLDEFCRPEPVLRPPVITPFADIDTGSGVSDDTGTDVDTGDDETLSVEASTARDVERVGAVWMVPLTRPLPMPMVPLMLERRHPW